MTLVAPPPTSDVDDAPAIAELHRLHAAQRAAQLADPYPGAAIRREQLAALAGMVLRHRDEIRAAMSADFGVHPELFTDLVEVLGIAGRAAYAIEQLDSWLAEDRRPIDPALFGTAQAACVNVCAVQGALPSLGFGGIGQSGSGRHHGIEGFREFSNPRGVVVRGSGDLADAFLPPYGATAQAIVDGALSAATPPEATGPGSV